MAANALNKYFKRVRFWFPRGFSKYFYTSQLVENKTKEEIKGIDENLKDELLFGVIKEAMKLQSNGKQVTYWHLVRTFGLPLRLTIKLILSNLPEEERDRFKKKCRLLYKSVATCAVGIIIALSVLSIHAYMIQTTVNVYEENTIFIKGNRDVPDVKNVNTFNFLEFMKSVE